MTLDQFLPPAPVKPKPTNGVYVEEKCSKCGEKIPFNKAKYTLKIKGKEAPYCQPCAKEILRPQENTGADL